MLNLRDIHDQAPLRVWNGVVARTIEGERLTLAVVELDADAIVPEHRHANEQLGMVLRGEVTFRLGTEVRTIGPGGSWRILANEPHAVTTGSEGAVVIDVFSPVREDWHQLPLEPARQPRWP
jgi:unsaturated pyranuronate lyase